MLISLDDAADPRLGDYTAMTDVRLRQVLEPERGLYMAESTNVIMRAVQAGHRPRSFLMAPRWLESMAPWIERSTGSADGGDVPVFLAPEDLLRTITGFHLHRGALAAMERPRLESVVEVLARHYRVRLAYNASCLVLKTNPSLARCGPEAAPTSS